MHLSTLACTVFHFFPQSQGRETSKNTVGAHRGARRCLGATFTEGCMLTFCKSECVFLRQSPWLGANPALHSGGSGEKLSIAPFKAHISLFQIKSSHMPPPRHLTLCKTIQKPSLQRSQVWEPQPWLTHDPVLCDSTHPYLLSVRCP